MADPGLREIDLEIRIRYSETDPMGFLHHSRYFVFFEMGRTELFRAQGGNYREMEERGQYLVIADVQCRYRVPARYDDVLRLNTKLTSLTLARMEHEYKFYRGDTLLTTGKTVLACVDRDGKILKLSDVLDNYELLVDR
ncbi:acyl-CoA thioesterase [Thalassoroseus pseudoceratinae]|uniref:acyl-CoA thioesterase n=1 Tax=Thalassoroseus pseudoceratinae TaxID=2713176 RepID=UPI00141DFEB8|nr:thioesterase family protein [Thalassoroseus pseudoceratinae]